jgi:DNA polymerase-3 subunit beta
MCVATNLDVGVSVNISGHVEEDGEIVVPPGLVQSFVASVGDGAKISAYVDESSISLVLQSGTSTVRIKGFAVDDFPPIPTQRGVAPTATFSCDVFKEGMSRAVVSVAQTEARPELTGVNMVFSEETLHVAATDGFRLSESVIDVISWEHVEGEYPSAIVPVSAVSEALYVIGDTAQKSLTLAMEDGQVFFVIGDVAIVSRVISGSYPNYKQIIPQNPTAVVVIAKSVVEQAVRLASAFSSRTTNDMKFNIDPTAGICTISAASQDSGDNETTVPIEGSGDQQEVYLNTQYVIDGLVRCAGQRVKMELSGPASPIVMRSDDDKAQSFLYLVMPIRK